MACKHAGDSGVPSHLAARHKPGEAPELWEMSGYLIGERHVDGRPVWRWRNVEYCPDLIVLADLPGSGRHLRS